MFLFGIGKLFYVALFLINAVAVLSEDRFLARIGWSPHSHEPSFAGSHDPGLKTNIVKLIASIRTVMRVPLIILNTGIILYELVLG